MAASTLDEQAVKFWYFLTRELAPYPGRLSNIVRIVIAATITALVIMTFGLPSAALSAFYTFIVSRESSQATLRSGLAIIACFCSGAVCAIVGVMLAVDYPLTHVLWVMASLFLCFFVIRVVTNYPAAAAFCFVIATSIPSWDVTGPIEAHVYAILWTTMAVAIGVLITIVVEFLFQSFVPADQVLEGIDSRLQQVQAMLCAHAEQQPVSEQVKGKLEQFAMVGGSRLRGQLARAPYEAGYTAQVTAALALAVRLVDIAANFERLPIVASDDDRARMRAAADKLAHVRRSLRQRKAPQITPITGDPGGSSGVPLLPALERTLDYIPFAFAGQSSIGTSPAGNSASDKSPTLPIVPDAFTNREHLFFAVKGTLAAGASYVIYNAINWVGISTCLATCLVTALGNVGSSRQKQALRLGGAIVGGILGIGSQVLLLPGMDSITPFLGLFAAVTAFSAWFSTASPRLSYLGLQIALAFDLIVLSEPHLQTSVAVARDRVVGVLLGLFCMWIFFEQPWTPSAAQQLLEYFAGSLRMLARLALLPVQSRDHQQAIAQARDLRDQINTNFTAVNAQADAVLFETSRQRERHLGTREQIRNWMPTLRTLYLLQLGLLRSLLDFPEDLPPDLQAAEKHFNTAFAAEFNGMADLLEGKPGNTSGPSLEQAWQEVEARLQPADEASKPTGRALAIPFLLQTVKEMTITLRDEIAQAHLPVHALSSRTAENKSPTLETR